VQLTVKPGESHLAENLALFGRLLRQEGLPVGAAEVIDALQALEEVDLTSRCDFKTTLQATLVKSRRDQVVFNRLFDLFFVPLEQHRQRAGEHQLQQAEAVKKLEAANLELLFKGEALELSPEELKQYSALSAEQRNRLQDFMQRTEAGYKVEPQFRPVLETVVKSHLRYCRSRDEAKQKKSLPAGHADGAGSGDSENELLREIDIEMIAASDLPAAEQLLQRLSRKLAVQILRRRRSGPRSGPLDLRRSLRDNMRYGGIIFKLRHRPKRRTKEHILLLCDVSASMKRYSTFVIHFLYGLHEAVRDLSCFSFSDQLEELSPELKGSSNLKQLLDRVIRRSRTWGGGTDIGSSVHKLAEKYPDRLNARTTVIIVSDTKTVQLDNALRELKKLKSRVKLLIWLNPLPTERWPEYRSVEIFSDLAEMWPCSTIAQLEEVLAGRLS
jgi:uncharacterized protein